MSDGIFKAGFDHPCKQTCSGWQQGYERGMADASDEHGVKRFHNYWMEACGERDKMKALMQSVVDRKLKRESSEWDNGYNCGISELQSLFKEFLK